MAVHHAAGGFASVVRATSALQSRDATTSWSELTALMDTSWAGAADLIVAGFYVAAHKEWPGGPNRNQLSAFVKFVEERYDEIVMVPEQVTIAVIGSVFTNDYRVFGFVPKDTLLTLQLLTTAAITAHRGIGSRQLVMFYENITRELNRLRSTR